MFNLIDPAFAQSAGGAAGFDFMGLAPLVVIFVAFYFFLIRPQQKKAQLQRDMLGAIQKGDQVITAGGVIGVIDAVEENQVILKVEDGTRMRLIKSSVAEKITGNIKSASSTKADNVTPLKAKESSKSTTSRRKPTARKTTTKKTTS